MPERVILVDRQDRAVGTAEKLRVHVHGRLHRAFSVFVFNTGGELLLQQRHPAKYHSGRLWSNTCCSHPRPGETVEAAARRRLDEEMGFSCELRPAFSFRYRAHLPGGLCEHEYDHVLVGRFDGTPRPNPQEVAGWHWADVHRLAEDIKERPGEYTCWFRLALVRMVALGRRRHASPRLADGTAGRHAAGRN